MMVHRRAPDFLAAPGHNVFECPDLCEEGERFELAYDSELDAMVMDYIGYCHCECHSG